MLHLPHPRCKLAEGHLWRMNCFLPLITRRAPVEPFQATGFSQVILATVLIPATDGWHFFFIQEGKQGAADSFRCLSFFPTPAAAVVWRGPRTPCLAGTKGEEQQLYRVRRSASDRGTLLGMAWKHIKLGARMFLFKWQFLLQRIRIAIKRPCQGQEGVR